MTDDKNPQECCDEDLSNRLNAVVRGIFEAHLRATPGGDPDPAMVKLAQVLGFLDEKGRA